MTNKERIVQKALGLTKRYPFAGSFEYDSQTFNWTITIDAINDDDAMEQLNIEINLQYPTLPKITVDAYIDPNRLQEVNENR